jgi:hypothetical protein
MLELNAVESMRSGLKIMLGSLYTLNHFLTLLLTTQCYANVPLSMQSPLIEKVLAREAGTEIAQHEEEGQTLQ